MEGGGNDDEDLFFVVKEGTFLEGEKVKDSEPFV